MEVKKILSELFNRSLSFKENIRLQKVVLVTGLFIVIYALVAIVSMPARLDLNIGRPSPMTIFAPRDGVDNYTTDMLREAASQAVPDVFDYDQSVLDSALNQIANFVDTVVRIQEDPSLVADAKMAALQDLLGAELPPPITAALLLTDQAILRDLQGRLNDTVSEIFRQGIKENELDLVRRRLFREIALFPFSSDLKQAAEKILGPLIMQNMFFNHEVTEHNRELARRQVETVIILRNTLIVSEGEPVTAQQMAQLENMGLIRGRQAHFPGYIGLFLLLVVVFVLTGVYLYIFVNKVYSRPSLLLLMGLVVVITLLFSVAATYFSGFLIPVAAGVILITVLFGYRLAVAINLVFVLLVGLISGGDFSVIVVALLGGLVSIYAVSTLSQRRDLVRAGFYVALTNAAVIVSTYLFFGNVILEYDALVGFGYSLLAGIGNGIFSAVIAIGLLPYLESGFGVTTAITLLELSDPNHPLLRELLQKAPGTYYHSMVVSNLSETAAESIKADALLARVGAYYHDIGKLKRPYYFSENQLSGENPHTRLSPNLSALIVGVHSKDGVELGRAHRLPELILDIAAQHHGTSMISFFYQQALKNGCQSNISMEKFRYDGPKPQTKVAAIIMLADAVEAGVRSLSKPMHNRVEVMVRSMIKDKLDDGQLDECDLTFKECDQITEAFMYIMTGIYHSRIEYPEKELKAEFERSAVLK